MTARAWLWLLRRDVMSQKPRLAILIACITMTATIVGLTFSAVTYLRSEIRPRLRELFPERRVVVRPSSADLFFLRMQGPRITDREVEQFRALDGVAALHPQMTAMFPSSATFEMKSLDVGFTTDIIMYGVDRDLISNDFGIKVDFPTKAGSAEPLPVLISEYFLDGYNLGLAESSGMPKLSRSAIIGVQFELILGESTVGLGEVKAAPMTIPARVVGLTKDPMLIGVVMPEETLREFNRRYVPDRDVTFAALHIDLESPENAEEVRKKASELKLTFEAKKEVLERYLKIVGTLEMCLLGGLAFVLVLAAVGVFTTMAASIRERRPAWGLHRATGLGRAGILVLASGHALAAALPSAVLASALCVLVSRILSRTLGVYTESISILPGNPFQFGAAGVASIILFSLLFALVPAWTFALPICRMRPVVLLSERSL